MKFSTEKKFNNIDKMVERIRGRSNESDVSRRNVKFSIIASNF